MMRDSDIRSVLTAQLTARYAREPATIVRQELGLCAGSRRIDLAVIGSELAGWEIKSDEDTLRRLDGQVKVYGQVLDRATLVTTQKHLESAVEHLPA